MQQNHSFNIEVAKECGLLAATIFNSIGYWCDKNETNERNFYDGFYWSYNSYDAFIKQMPYASKPQIKLAIQKLIDSNYIIVGNYNDSKFDKTNWYALTEKGYSMFHNCPLDGTELSLDGTELSDGEDRNVSSYIYNIYTNNKPNKKHTNSKPNTAHKNLEIENFGEYVSMTKNEYEKLINEFGEKDTKRLIEILDNYKGSSGKKYKSDYRAILTWTVNRLKEEKSGKNKFGSVQETFSDCNYGVSDDFSY